MFIGRNINIKQSAEIAIWYMKHTAFKERENKLEIAGGNNRPKRLTYLMW